MAQDDHGKCPKCGSDLNGGSIWEHFYFQGIQHGHYPDYKPLAPGFAELAADRIAEMYGATRTNGKWGRAIGIEKDRDRIEEWECPDCKHRWLR